MINLKFFGLLSIVALFMFPSCESVEEAQVFADEFFEAYNTEDKAKMESLLDKESVIDAGIANEFYNVFNKHWKAYGKVTSYSRYAFATNINNGITTVLLKFKCETEKGKTVYEILRFVKRGDEYKVIQFEYNIDKSALDKQSE